MQDKQIYIADTVHNTILLSSYEKEVISTQLFNRLHHISQNSTAYLTFPTNRTKRFEHSLGTMKLCGDMFFCSFGNSTIDDISSFFDEIKKDLINQVVNNNILTNTDMFRPILGDRNLSNEKLERIENFKITSVFYNNFTPKNISQVNQNIYLISFQAVRICGLLHDVGHPPFSHITESAINNVYKEVNAKENRTANEDEFIDIINQYYLGNDSIQLHEQMGNKMTSKMVSDILYSSNWYQLLNFDEKYFKILVFEMVKLIFEEKTASFKALHRIIDGIIDGDRLDYVNRDIVNSGINNGVIEYDRLISSMKIAKVDETYAFVSDVKTVNTVEDFFFKRWNLYKNIVYHHRVIKTDSLLQNSIEGIMKNYLLKTTVSSKQTDPVLPYDISGLWKAIKIAHSNEKYFNSLIQWDDNWLLAILKKHFFLEYYEDMDNPISYQLEELLSNKKNYYSLIKNNSDFKIFREKFEANIKLDKVVNSQEFQDVKTILLGNSYKTTVFHTVIAFLQFYGIDIKDFIQKEIEKFILEKYSYIKHHIVSYKSIKTGLSSIEPLVYKGNQLLELSNVSNIRTILETEKFDFPYFYIYLKFYDEFKIPEDFAKVFLESLAEDLANKINKIILEEN